MSDDRPPGARLAPAGVRDGSDTGVATERPRPPLARRRDKPQLSCNACRSRKVRCDRQQPCGYCTAKGMASSCTFPTHQTKLRAHSQSSLDAQGRINELENLVFNLMQQTPSSTQALPSEAFDLQATGSNNGTDHSASQPQPRNGQMLQSTTTTTSSPHEQRSPKIDHGRMQIRDSGPSYVSSAHWAAILNSIAGLRDQIELEDYLPEPLADHGQPPDSSPNPQLLYGGTPSAMDLSSILQVLPPQVVVDRLVFQYFTVLDMIPGVPHRNKFQREYKQFWDAPQSVPIAWVGLLFAIVTLSTQYQQLFRTSVSTPSSSAASMTAPRPAQESRAQVREYKSKIVQCLHLAHYTRGGPHVLETLVLYFMIEGSLTKNTQGGLWLLAGNLVQIAMQSGYHQDSSHFPNISVFEGEMRRRIWAQIVQIDFTVSSQVGLPRLIKESQTDTAEPQNILDSDFDEMSSELPPARPESEITALLYMQGKVRLLSFGIKVMNVVTELRRPHSYEEILEVDKYLDGARDALPAGMRWDGLAGCLTVPSQTISQRIWLEVSIHRMKIELHQKYLIASREEPHFAYSRSVCAKAAVEILEFQHLIDEETKVDGRLYRSRWKSARAFVHDFLLATSTLCFYVDSYDDAAASQHDAPVLTAVSDAPDMPKIKQLLRGSLLIWLRESGTSKEARKAVAALHYVLGDDPVNEVPPESMDILGFSPGLDPISYLPGLPDLMSGQDAPGLGMDPVFGRFLWHRNKTDNIDDSTTWTDLDNSQLMNMDI